MFKLYDKLQNLRCPNCNAIQSAFQLSLTFKHLLNGFAANSWTMCPNCQSKLKLVARFNFLATFVFMMASAVVFCVFFFLPLLVGFAGLRDFVGNFAILSLPLLVLAYFLANACWARFMNPLFREITVV